MIPVAVFNSYPLQPFNTLRIEANAKKAAFISNARELEYLRYLGLLNGKKLVLGSGSNILLMKDFDGLVLFNRMLGHKIVSEDEQSVEVKWAAGENWHQLVLFAIAQGWGGIENLALIPGCIGAAPIQNIGAYGVEIKDVFVAAEVYSFETGLLTTYDNKACNFGYRDSIFKQSLTGKVLITSVTLRLTKPGFHQLKLNYVALDTTLKQQRVEQPEITDVAEAVLAIRQSKLPDPVVLPNAGSFFKNPEISTVEFERLKDIHPTMPSYPSGNKIKVPAGWLIEQCGLKGYKAERCGVHAHQALVLVNFGNATGQELISLAEFVIDKVKEKFNIQLIPEVNWIG